MNAGGSVAAVYAQCEVAIVSGVFRQVGVEQIKRATTDVDAPRAETDGCRGEVHGAREGGGGGSVVW